MSEYVAPCSTCLLFHAPFHTCAEAATAREWEKGPSKRQIGLRGMLGGEVCMQPEAYYLIWKSWNDIPIYEMTLLLAWLPLVTSHTITRRIASTATCSHMFQWRLHIPQQPSAQAGVVGVILPFGNFAAGKKKRIICCAYQFLPILSITIHLDATSRYNWLAFHLHRVSCWHGYTACYIAATMMLLVIILLIFISSIS